MLQPRKGISDFVLIMTGPFRTIKVRQLSNMSQFPLPPAKVRFPLEDPEHLSPSLGHLVHKATFAHTNEHDNNLQEIETVHLHGSS